MEKNSSPADDYKARKPRYWIIFASFATIFAAVFLFSLAGTYAVDHAEEALKNAVLEKIQKLAREFSITFEKFEKGTSKKGKKPDRYDDMPVEKTFAPLDFNGRPPKHWAQFSQGSKGSFTRERERSNGFMALEVVSLTPAPSGKDYFVNGLMDIGVRLETSNLKSVYFSVRSKEFTRFTFFFWSRVDGKWRYNTVRNLKATPEWQRLEIEFAELKSMGENSGPVDMITTAGWGVSRFNNAPGQKGILNIDDFGFLEKTP